MNRLTQLFSITLLICGITVNLYASINLDPNTLDNSTGAAGMQSGNDAYNSMIKSQNQTEANQELEAKNQTEATNMSPTQIQSAAFLSANSKEPGVVTLPNGLQYKILQEGTGPKPQATSTVTVDYEGKLIDGKVFDSSYARGEPISFALNQVIPGWQQGVAMMPVGSTWILYIPADLAYGAQGVPGVIPPNSALIFKIHLISIQ